MTVIGAMEEKKGENVVSRKIADKVSDETSEVFALFTGLISSLRNCNRTFEIAGRLFEVDIDSMGTVKTSPVEKKNQTHSLSKPK